MLLFESKEVQIILSGFLTQIMGFKPQFPGFFDTAYLLAFFISLFWL